MRSLRNLIGIDIGGTKMAVAAVHPSGAILARTTLPTEAERGFDRALERLVAAISEVDENASVDPERSGMVTTIPAAKRPVQPAIGIGCAGPVDPIRGLINNPFTLTGWNRCDIVKPLAQRFGVPVRLENDADVAALGECWIGAGRGVHPVVMLTFGTGVGGGTVLASGALLRGAHGEHPELGHVPVEPEGPNCYCGIRGCLESIASGTAIGVAGKAIGVTDARSVFEAARAGQPTARAIVQRAGRAIAAAAWTLFHTILPRRLVLGGGIMETEFDTFAKPILDHLRTATQFTPTGIEIVPAKLGNDAGIIGAAALVAKGARTTRR